MKQPSTPYPTDRLSDNSTDTEQLLQVIAQNLLSNPSISHLARSCNQSPSTFKRNFVATFGTTPHRWFTIQKMEIARLMVVDSDVPVKNICRACGFTNESHFIRLFKRHHGLTPTALRQQHLQHLQRQQHQTK